MICQLEIKDPALLRLTILDYDDHRGIDLLVQRENDPGDLLSKKKVAYTELKYRLHDNLNHAFAHLHTIICWESTVTDRGEVTDVTGETFTLDEYKDDRDGVTYSMLRPKPNSKRSLHNIRLIVLKRLLEETRQYQETKNPRPVNGRRG